MKELFRRPSLWAFVLILLVGIFTPFLFDESPNAVVGAPFARPIWWGRNLSRSAEATIDLRDGATAMSGFSDKNPVMHDGEFSFDWQSEAAEIFSLEGYLTPSDSTAGNGGSAEVTWRTPNGSFTLARAQGSERQWLNIDARDMIFKQSLGLPLIGRAVESLFPTQGRYSLSINGASEAHLKLTLRGRAQGILGTDQRGRDVFALLCSGVDRSLTVGIFATLTATVLGLGLGLLSGYAGGFIDALIMRAVDILLSIPTLPILMTLAGIWGKGLWQLVLILSIFSWMGTARSVRALVLSVRESPWVDGLKALGARRGYILWRHLVPETTPILLANVALGVPGAILSEAGLAFLGLSDPRMISWGRMLHEAHSFGAFTEGAWWLILPPGLGIVVICLIFMDIGRFLEEKIDPRLKNDKRGG